MEPIDTKDSLQTFSKTEKASKSFKMEINTKDTIKTANHKDMVNIIGLMVPRTKGIL